MIQNRWDPLRTGQGSRSGNFPEIGLDPALEELVDVQNPDPDRATVPAAELLDLYQVMIWKGCARTDSYSGRKRP